MAARKRLTTLLTPAEIKRLATPANYRYGEAMHRRGGVEIIERDSYQAVAWAGGLDGTSAEGGGQRRRVTLTAAVEGVHWHCAGNPKNHQIFCKHCVALALALRRAAPKKK
jgi:hypothetical protein